MEKPGLELNTQLCFALYSTMLGLNKAYRKHLSKLDLTYPQYLVMLVLWENDKLKVSEICSRLFLETTTVTPLLKRLEARGYITRLRSSTDERQVIISLTEQGASLKEQAQDIPEQLMQTMHCSSTELIDLRDQLIKLRGNLNSKS